VAKRCEIGTRLLLITNRKLHIGFQMTCKSLTLDDLEGLSRLDLTRTVELMCTH